MAPLKIAAAQSRPPLPALPGPALGLLRAPFACPVAGKRSEECPEARGRVML